MKNIRKRKDGYWIFEQMHEGKRRAKIFKTRQLAEEYSRKNKKAQELDLTYFAKLSSAQRLDIRQALGALPEGKTLFESVRRAWRWYSEKSLPEMLEAFFEAKKRKHEADRLAKDEFIHIRGRIGDIGKNFKTFADITPQSVVEYLRSKGQNKTISHYRGTLGEFLQFCVDKGVLSDNAVSHVHGDELLTPEDAKEIEFLSVEQAKTLMATLEASYPQYCRFYALALFAGIRVAEIPRLQEEYFRFPERQIIFPARIGKVRKAWTLENLPSNLWRWLEKYKGTPIKRPSNTLRTTLGKRLKLPHNFARHSFATYHLSLFMDVEKTAMITRNSAQMLRNHYWGALVGREQARAYFSILPARGG